MRINPYECVNNTIYLSPGRDPVKKWIDGVYLEFWLDYAGLNIGKNSVDGQSSLEITPHIEIFNYVGECVYVKNDEDVTFPVLWDSIRAYGQIDIWTFAIPPVDNYLALTIKNITVDGKIRNFDRLKRELCNTREKRAHFRDIRCKRNDFVRVNTKILSDNCQYFKNMFNEHKRGYNLDCEAHDLIEMIYCLPPFNLRVKSGPTYGALFRLSEFFKCTKLADLCDNYMNQLKKHNRLHASLVAKEGCVFDKYYPNNLEEWKIWGLFSNENRNQDEWYEQWHILENDYPCFSSSVEYCPDEARRR